MLVIGAAMGLYSSVSSRRRAVGAIHRRLCASIHANELPLEFIEILESFVNSSSKIDKLRIKSANNYAGVIGSQTVQENEVFTIKS